MIARCSWIRPFDAETFFGIALIGHERSGRYYFPLGRVADRDAVANLSQVRLFDGEAEAICKISLPPMW